MKLDDYGRKKVITTVCTYYIKHGQYHNDNGPAIATSEGMNYYFINGYQINEKAFKYIIPMYSKNNLHKLDLTLYGKTDTSEWLID